MNNALLLLTDLATENPETTEEVVEEAFNLVETLNENPGVTAAIGCAVVAIVVIVAALVNKKKKRR